MPKARPSQGNGGTACFRSCQNLFVLLAPPGLIQNFRNLVTRKDPPLQMLLFQPVVCVNVRTASILEQSLAALQFIHQIRQHFQKVMFIEAHPALKVPDGEEINPAFKIRNKQFSPLVERLHKQQLEKGALAAPRGAAQENVGDMGQIDRSQAPAGFLPAPARNCPGKGIHLSNGAGWASRS